MSHTYPDVDVAEYAQGGTWSPLLLTARRERSVGFLIAFVDAHSESLKADIARYGAVIFRRFQLRNENDFDRVIRAIRGFHPMSETFMTQVGRKPIGETPAVFATDTNLVTGGGFTFSFHSEHYYSADVPSFHCWVCLTAPWFGGHTALVSSAGVYDELSEAMKLRLREHAFACRAWPLAEVAVRYGLPTSEMERFCNAVGLTIAPIHGVPHVVLKKPTIWKHPATGRLCLQVNLNGELPALYPALANELRANGYGGRIWSLHHAVWRRPFPTAFALEHLIHYLSRPHLYARLARLLSARRKAPPPVTLPVQETFRAAWQDQDIAALARAVRKHTVQLAWRKSDVLLLDNRQTFHSGMPGFFLPRTLRVAMCNPVPWQQANGGYREIPPAEACNESLVDRLRRFKASRAAAPVT